MKRYKVAPWMYNPPILGIVNGLLGAINLGNAIGGTNWPGVAYDPETRTIYAQANNVNITSTSLAPPPRSYSDIRCSRASPFPRPASPARLASA